MGYTFILPCFFLAVFPGQTDFRLFAFSLFCLVERVDIFRVPRHIALRYYSVAPHPTSFGYVVPLAIQLAPRRSNKTASLLRVANPTAVMLHSRQPLKSAANVKKIVCMGKLKLAPPIKISPRLRIIQQMTLYTHYCLWGSIRKTGKERVSATFFNKKDPSL
jgi:hypothetical protein